MKKYQLLKAGIVTAALLRAVCIGALSVVLIAPVPACADPDHAAEKIFSHRIVAVHPHDVTAFTQGLVYFDGRLVESAGGFGNSSIAIRGITKSTAHRRQPLPRDQFGEGVAKVRDRLIQLTWTSGVAHVYDLLLRPVGQFRYTGEGWGLTFDGRRLIMSDGSSQLQYRDPLTFELSHRVRVTANAGPVARLNELEFAHGHVYANVWHSERIAVIDPDSGRVAGWLELSELRRSFDKPPGWNPDEHVLNGIAFNPDRGRFYVTGKCWPVLFELEVEAPAAPSAGRAAPQ